MSNNILEVYRECTEELLKRIYETKTSEYYDQFFDFDCIGIEGMRNFLLTDEKYNPNAPLISNISAVFEDEYRFFKDRHRFYDEDLVLSVFGSDKRDLFDGIAGIEKIEFLKTLLKFCLYTALDRDFDRSREKEFLDRLWEQMMNMPEEKYVEIREEDPSERFAMISSIEKANASPIPRYDIELNLGKPELLTAKTFYLGPWVEGNGMLFAPLGDLAGRTYDWQVINEKMAVGMDVPNALMFPIKRLHPEKEATYEIVRLPLNEKDVCLSSEEAHSLESEMRFTYLHSKIKIGTDITAKNAEGKTRNISAKTYADLVDFLVPKYKVIDMGNGLRKIVFYDYVLVKDQVFRFSKRCIMG